MGHKLINRILILRPGAIGDTLLTFPALQLLRDRFPGAEIDVVGNRPVLCLAREAAIAHAVDAFGADWVGDLFGDEPTAALRGRLERYDLGIVWMHSAEAASDLATRLGAAGVQDVFPLVSFPPATSRRHVADHLVDTLAPVGIVGPQPAIVLPWGESLAQGRGQSPFSGRGDQGPAADFPTAETRPLAVLHPGAGARRKRWLAARYATLGERLIARGYSLAVTSGPADEDAVAAVRAALGHDVRILSGLELRDLAATLARASIVVGNDSGITHLAAMVGAPTVAIFGPFDPVFWAPIGPRVVIVDAGRDCTHRQDPRDGCRTCDLLPGLSVEEVWAATEPLLEPPNAG